MTANDSCEPVFSRTRRAADETMRRSKFIWIQAIAAAGVILLLLAAPPGPVSLMVDKVAAASTDLDRLKQELREKENQKRSLEAELNRTTQQLAETKRRELGLKAEYNRIEAQLRAAIQRKQELDNRLAEARVKVEEAGIALQEAEGRLAEQTNFLSRRVRAIYENGTVSYLEVLLGATSFSDFITRFDILNRVVASDVDLFYQVEESRNEAAKLRSELIAWENELKSLRDQVAAEEREINAHLAAKSRSLSEISRNRAALEAEYRELDRINKQLEREIFQLQYKYKVAAGELAFIRPVKGGWISSPFGSRYHPILRTYKTHTGVDIAVPWGTPVMASETGIVVRADYLGGYGNTVVILHDSARGISTLYAHNASLLVREGQVVNRGQVIAKAGSTGLSTGPHVHFEVRIDGVAVDPMPYITP